MTKNRIEHDRIFDGDEFSGTYVTYGATPCGCITPFTCYVEIHSGQVERDGDYYVETLDGKISG